MIFKITCGAKEAGGWGYTPSEFWNMALSDWWLIYEANFGEQQETKRSTMDRLRGYLDGA